ncbi:MAG: histidine phosphatase family protein [Caulobacteraceae bacterium]
MDRLILLRHGKADSEATSGQDFDRALTDRGKRDTVLVARALAEAGVYPDLVLVSSAARAVQTWEAAAAVFSRTEVRLIPALYEIAPADILDLARSEGQAVSTLMIVGHNPRSRRPVPCGWRVRRGRRATPWRRSRWVFPPAAASVTGFDPPSFTLYSPKPLGGGS